MTKGIFRKKHMYNESAFYSTKKSFRMCPRVSLIVLFMICMKMFFLLDEQRDFFYFKNCIKLFYFNQEHIYPMCKHFLYKEQLNKKLEAEICQKK